MIEQFGNESNLFLPVSMNIQDEVDVKAAVEQICTKLERIDVLMNNAGYTHLATIEEIDMDAAHTLFDVNVFGLLNVTRAVLPIMRKQHSGYIFNFSSLGAYNVGSLSGLYCATKHAVKAISETQAQEVREFGIYVTDINPGFMRTEFFGASYQTTISDGSPYQSFYNENMKFYMGQNGAQIGELDRAAELYIKVAEIKNPYESLPMGTDSCYGICEICAKTVKLMDEMREIAATTNY